MCEYGLRNFCCHAVRMFAKLKEKKNFQFVDFILQVRRFLQDGLENEWGKTHIDKPRGVVRR